MKKKMSIKLLFELKKRMNVCYRSRLRQTCKLLATPFQSAEMQEQLTSTESENLKAAIETHITHILFFMIKRVAQFCIL